MVCMEHIYRRLKRRWRILKFLRCKYSYARETVIACCVLHNIGLLWADPVPDDEEVVVMGPPRSCGRPCHPEWEWWGARPDLGSRPGSPGSPVYQHASLMGQCCGSGIYTGSWLFNLPGSWISNSGSWKAKLFRIQGSKMYQIRIRNTGVGFGKQVLICASPEKILYRTGTVVRASANSC
jgi:hypothetical protein